MVGDGIENCLMYAANFDPTKSKNPFSYFTQIIYYAFIRRIQKEKKQNYIKFKCIEMARTNGTVPKWLNQAYNDESKIQDFFKSLSLSDLDLENFKGTKKKEAKEAAKEVAAKVEVVAKKAAKKVTKKKSKK